jgi:hypothetical protein
MCRDKRRQRLANRKANDKLAPTEKPGARSEYFKDYNKNRRKPSPPKSRKKPTEEQKAKRSAYNKVYRANMTEEQKEKQRASRRAYRTRKKAEKEALAKL